MIQLYAVLMNSFQNNCTETGHREGSCWDFFAQLWVVEQHLATMAKIKECGASVELCLILCQPVFFLILYATKVIEAALFHRHTWGSKCMSQIRNGTITVLVIPLLCLLSLCCGVSAPATSSSFLSSPFVRKVTGNLSGGPHEPRCCSFCMNNLEHIVLIIPSLFTCWGTHMPGKLAASPADWDRDSERT